MQTLHYYIEIQGTDLVNVPTPVTPYVLEKKGIPGYGCVGEHQLCLPCNTQPDPRIHLIGELALSSKAQTKHWLQRRPSQSPLHLIHLCNVGSHISTFVDTQRSDKFGGEIYLQI